MRELAGRIRIITCTEFKRRFDIGTGHIDDRDHIAERKYRQQVTHGDHAGFDGCPDAAAVRDDHVSAGRGQHGVGDEVSEIRFLASHILAFTVQMNAQFADFYRRETLIFLFNGGDRCEQFCIRLILLCFHEVDVFGGGLGQLAVGEGHRNEADVFQIASGHDDQAVVVQFAVGNLVVAVAVNDEVDAFDLVQYVF